MARVLYAWRDLSSSTTPLVQVTVRYIGHSYLNPRYPLNRQTSLHGDVRAFTRSQKNANRVEL